MHINEPNFANLREMLTGIQNQTCAKCGSRDWSLRIDYNNLWDSDFETDFIWCWNCEQETDVVLSSEGGDA